MFFALRPSRAILSDVNRDLIETYQAIGKDWRLVSAGLRKHQKLHSRGYYYRVRSSKPRNPARRAARLIYLNRTCWNGLHRVNRRGLFNVPIGTKTAVCLPTDNFERTHALLSGARMMVSDFEPVVDMAGEGDLVFADPPYKIPSHENGFSKYSEKLFGWTDQIRLRDSLQRAKERGVFVVATNADHPSIRRLYGEGFRVRALQRPSVIASNPRYRQAIRELLITANEVDPR